MTLPIDVPVAMLPWPLVSRAPFAWLYGSRRCTLADPSPGGLALGWWHPQATYLERDDLDARLARWRCSVCRAIFLAAPSVWPDLEGS